MAPFAEIGKNIKNIHEYRNDVWKCVRCGICRMTNPDMLSSHKYSDNCPSGTRFKYEAYFASGRHELIRALTTSPPELEIDDAVKHVVYTCTLCGNCQANCNPVKDLEPTNAFIALREYLVKIGEGPLPQHQPLIKSILNYDNPWQQPRNLRDRWAKELNIKDLSKEKAEYLFFVGCTAAYDPVARRTAIAAANIMKSAGVDFGILGKDEVCCGSTVMRIGDRANFNQIKRKSSDRVRSTGVKGIITACSGCFSTFRHEYTDELGNVEVFHLAQFMDNLLQQGKLEFKKEINLKVTYHDPCHLGRYNSVYDAPRNLIKAIPGLKFTEMERIRHYSFCCGAGAGVRTAFPDVALWTASKRIEEAKDTGADTILSCCPFCEQNLNQAAQPAGMQVLDLMWLLNNALGLPEV